MNCLNHVNVIEYYMLWMFGGVALVSLWRSVLAFFLAAGQSTDSLLTHMLQPAFNLTDNTTTRQTLMHGHLQKLFPLTRTNLHKTVNNMKNLNTK